MCLHFGVGFFIEKGYPGSLGNEHGAGLSGSTSLFPFPIFLLLGYFPNLG